MARMPHVVRAPEPLRVAEEVRPYGRRKPATRASKISVTVDAGVLLEVKRVLRGTGESLSAHVTHALEQDLRRRRLRAILEEYEASHGKITREELLEAQAAWQA